MKVCKQHLTPTVNKMLQEKVADGKEPVLFIRRTKELTPCEEHIKDHRVRVRSSKCSLIATYEVK